MAPTNKQRSQRESPLKKKKKRSPYQDTRAKFALREQALQKRHKQVLDAVVLEFNILQRLHKYHINKSQGQIFEFYEGTFGSPMGYNR